MPKPCSSHIGTLASCALQTKVAVFRRTSLPGSAMIHPYFLMIPGAARFVPRASVLSSSSSAILLMHAAPKPTLSTDRNAYGREDTQSGEMPAPRLLHGIRQSPSRRKGYVRNNVRLRFNVIMESWISMLKSWKRNVFLQSFMHDDQAC